MLGKKYLPFVIGQLIAQWIIVETCHSLPNLPKLVSIYVRVKNTLLPDNYLHSYVVGAV